MYVAHSIEDLVVSDLRRSIEVDFSRKSLRLVVVCADHSGAAVDGVLDEGEQAFDRLTQAPIDPFSGLEVEDGGDGVTQNNDIKRMDIPAETTALDRERVSVEILCAPPTARGLELR